MRSAGVVGLLESAVRRDTARPLITAYDDATGERTELSVTTFANWVAKTANLLQDDLAVEPGQRVSLNLPLHWQAAVWLQACWAVGLHAVSADSPADIVVVSYDSGGPGHADSGAAEHVVALGLGPMGLPRRDAAAPAGTTCDYDREVHSHGDRFVAYAPADADASALTTPEGTFTGAELADLATAAPSPRAGARLLVTDPLTSVDLVLGGLLVPLAHEVTAVLCRNLDLDRLPERVTQENVVAHVGPEHGSGLPAWP